MPWRAPVGLSRHAIQIPAVQGFLNSSDICVMTQIDDGEGGPPVEHDRVIVDIKVDTLSPKSFDDRLHLLGGDDDVGPAVPSVETARGASARVDRITIIRSVECR